MFETNAHADRRRCCHGVTNAVCFVRVCEPRRGPGRSQQCCVDLSFSDSSCVLFCETHLLVFWTIKQSTQQHSISTRSLHVFVMDPSRDPVT
jgi:hypothetical protein